jgi:hypothetical protein
MAMKIVFSNAIPGLPPGRVGEHMLHTRFDYCLVGARHAPHPAMKAAKMAGVAARPDVFVLVFHHAVAVLAGLGIQVLFGILVELYLATSGAEVIGCAFVGRCSGSFLFINGHTTDRINSHLLCILLFV